MRFTHIADCHIGSYRDEKLRDLSTQGFVRALDWSVEHKVDFILIAGDLFNTALPGIDNLKRVTQKLHDIKKQDIPVYLIAGSHDFSPTGKTMLDVLEEAGLVKNVMRGSITNDNLNLKFTVDPKTGAKLTGILGKRGTLDKRYYEHLHREPLEKEPGFKIFLFHTTLSEYKPEDLEDAESAPISLLPKNFNYYAGGHVHYRFDKQEPGYGLIVYPGPIFPNSFSELEKLHQGGFCYYEDGIMRRVPIKLKEVVAIQADAQGKSPQQVIDEVRTSLENKNVKDAIVLIRIGGKLSRGKTTDVNLATLFEDLYARGAFFILKNTSRLESEEFAALKTLSDETPDIEDALIREHAGQIKVNDWPRSKEINITAKLMKVFASEKREGEKAYEFETRLLEETDLVLEVADKEIDREKE